jgi:hypothetical protein
MAFARLAANPGAGRNSGRSSGFGSGHATRKTLPAVFQSVVKGIAELPSDTVIDGKSFPSTQAESPPSTSSKASGAGHQQLCSEAARSKPESNEPVKAACPRISSLRPVERYIDPRMRAPFFHCDNGKGRLAPAL